jgi:Na+:H+ antiporter, NhaA family
MNFFRAALILVALFLNRAAFAAGGDEIRPANAVGPANAPVTIEYFSDLQCPQCARYEPVVKSVRAEFGDKARMVVRHFPLANMHVHAELAAYAAEAAANQHKFWEMIEALYKTQWMWGKAPAPRVIILDQAKQLGLDTDKLEKDMDGADVRDRVAADQRLGQKLGVKMVPTVIINGYNVPNAELNENGVRAAIKAALAKPAQ